MTGRKRIFLTLLFGILCLLIITMPVSAQYNYTIIDPLRGDTIEDGVNTDFWEPSIGAPGTGGASETGYASISDDGLVLGSFNATLGLRSGEEPAMKWLLTGDFRVTFHLEVSPNPGGYGNRLGAYIYESAPVCGPLIYPEGYGGLWIGTSPPLADRYYPLQYGDAAYFLYVKSGNTLTIYKGDSNGVSDDPANQVFLGSYFNPSGQFLFGVGTGNPNTGWLKMRDVTIETEGLVACDGTTDIPPEWAAGSSRAFWTIGVGEIRGNSIIVDEMYYTTGGAFGADFNPNEISTLLWGSLDIHFQTCGSGQVNWTSVVPGYDPGGYDIFRLAANPLGDECVETGFDAVDNFLWMSGIWYGGATRDGEGFSVNIINGERAIVTWYTYLPVDTD